MRCWRSDWNRHTDRDACTLLFQPGADYLQTLLQHGRLWQPDGCVQINFDNQRSGLIIP